MSINKQPHQGEWYVVGISDKNFKVAILKMLQQVRNNRKCSKSIEARR
jgi:hypothetical protein